MSCLGQHNQTRLTKLNKTTLETDDLYHFYVDALIVQESSAALKAENKQHVLKMKRRLCCSTYST